ncbi:MAG: dihydroorotate dehydrogenase electron transfer subunit [Oscillospiraceae bacterium]|nr:dihydroorotate dehydrogenase electron transfer subunit [Oscillospiraceae bacterium]
MYKCKLYHVIEKKAISAGVYSFTVLCGDIAALAVPGQFVHIKVEGFTLRRPISICDIDKDEGTIRIVFEVRGCGTAKLAETRVGDSIDLLGPLGNGFELPSQTENSSLNAILIGGGMGVAPLYGMAKLHANKAVALMGFRGYDKIILADDFKQTGAQVIICTQDGSVGTKGLVTEPLNKLLESDDVGVVYACGPVPMLKAVAEICTRANVLCRVSLEERMACGVGACAGCACKSVGETGEQMVRVCKEGPVFNAREVLL